MGQLDGRVAFVTGASRGIGAAVGRRLAEEGASVALASRSGDDLGLAGALAVACDVRSAEQIDRAVAAAVERFGRLDVLVNNAGTGAYGDFLELAPEYLEEMVDVNLKGTLYATRAALPHLLRSDAADVVVIASVAGLRGLPGEAVTASATAIAVTRSSRPKASGRPRQSSRGASPAAPIATSVCPRRQGRPKESE